VEAVSMNLEQIAADAAEDSRIRRYRQLSAAPYMRSTMVSCGRCGREQPVMAQEGMRRVALVCSACGERSMASVR
jgi:transcription elongation factor Elf1